MRRVLGGLLMLMCAVPLQAQEGPLQRVRDTLDRPDDDKSSKVSSSSSSGDDDNDANGFFGELIFYSALAPFALPHLALGDDFGRPGYFPHFPYAENRAGYLSSQDKLGPLNTFSIRLSAEYGNDFHGIERFGTRLLIDTTSRFGLEASNDFFREKFSCGCTDELDLASVNLTYRFAQNPAVQMYGGIGLNVLDDGWRTHYGINFIYGADIFPVKPFIASLSVEGGTVEDAGLFRARGTIGVNFRNFESFIGYDYLNIGGVDLQGPLAGLRFWY